MLELVVQSAKAADSPAISDLRKFAERGGITVEDVSATPGLYCDGSAIGSARIRKINGRVCKNVYYCMLVLAPRSLPTTLCPLADSELRVAGPPAHSAEDF